MRKRFKEYFTFTRKERNGIIVLFVILFVLILVRVYQSNKSYGKIVLMDNDFKNDIEEFEQSLILKKDKRVNNFILSKEKHNSDVESWTEPKVLFDFDPNTISEGQLKKLGFSEKQAQILINFRKSGGRFFKKEDLLKIYGIEKEQYSFLKPYINIEREDKSEHKFVKKTVKKELIEINSASKEDLIKLKGIGNTYAERIIKYRKLLGGFYKKNQLLEVYGMDSSRYFSFAKNVTVDTNIIEKINLNESTFKDLIKHPYLNKYETESILKYKEIVGEFSNIEQIYQNNLLTKEEFLKLKPYLKLK